MAFYAGLLLTAHSASGKTILLFLAGIAVGCSMMGFADAVAEWIMPSETTKKYKSRIDAVPLHTTASGAVWVEPFDVVRSRKGRETIKKHSTMPDRFTDTSGMSPVEIRNGEVTKGKISQ